MGEAEDSVQEVRQPTAESGEHVFTVERIALPNDALTAVRPVDSRLLILAGACR
jgi:hypothetical protein